MMNIIQNIKSDDYTSELKLVVFMVCVAGFLYGYDIGVMSGTLFYISDSIPMSEKELEIVVGAVFMGALLGSLLSGPLADHIGRRISVRLASVCFIAAISIISIGQTVLSLLIARILLGIGIGFISVIIPIYTVELVPATSRGKILTLFQIFLTFGILLAYTVNFFLAFSENWRAMFGVLLVPASVLLVTSYFLPETPRWLIGKEKILEARNILMRINKRSAIETEKEIERIRLYNQTHNGYWKDFLLKENLKVLGLVCIVALCNQLIGTSAILQYAPVLMKSFGFDTNSTSMLGTLAIGFLNFLFTIIAFIYVDSLGRKPLLLIGIFGVFVADAMICTVNLTNLSPDIKIVLNSIGIFTFISFFAIGPGAIVWLVLSEHFPNKLRAKGVALSLFFNSLASTIISSSFLFTLSFVGVSGMFLIFSIFSIIYYFTVKTFLCEATNKELEEISYASPVRQLKNY